MELSAGQRKLAFVIVVAALGGLGTLLVAPGWGSRPARAGRSSASAPPPSGAPAAAATPSASASSAGTPVDIYRLLPFTQSGLSAAVAVVQRFAVDYGTFSYQQDAAGYVSPMRDLVTPELATALERGYATPGVAQTRIGQQQVSTADAVVSQLRAFGPSSLTFVVDVAQSLTTTQGSSRIVTRYAVTVVNTGVGWRVTDIQLASAGNS